ncbi:MAG TPA: hypothetical protein VK640_12340 [Actinomycetes bacterium]|nr:hypothetical protein [Actinomycetes bacterium]
METREGRDVEVQRGPEVVVGTESGTSAGERAVDGPPPVRPRRRLVAGLVALLALVFAATVVLVLVLGGDDEPEVTTRTPAAADPAGPASLGLTVEVPDRVVAGQPASLVVRWADGEGVFNGSTEEWGDGVGTSSLAQDSCAASATAAQDRPSAGRYVASHTWAEPGTYQVTIGVASYLCTGGTATQEDARTTVSVQVLPAG